MENSLSFLNYKSIFEENDKIYTSCYCEENVFKLCEAFSKKSLPKEISIKNLEKGVEIFDLKHEGYVSFLTNSEKYMSIKNQKLGNITKLF